MSDDKRFEITIVVNGKPEGLKVGLDEQIGEAVKAASISSHPPSLRTP